MTWRAIMTVAAALAACIGCAWLIWEWQSRPAPPPVSVSVPLPPAPQAENKPTERVVVKTVVVYKDRPVPLPGAATTEKVTATARLEAEERPYTLSATLDTETGQSRIWAQAEPLPWLAITTRGEAGLAYGLRDGDPVWRLSARQDMLQIKAARLAGVASLDSDGQWFAGVGVRVGW